MRIYTLSLTTMAVTAMDGDDSETGIVCVFNVTSFSMIIRL